MRVYAVAWTRPSMPITILTKRKQEALNEGENPVYAKEKLGHSSIKITVDIFGHILKNGHDYNPRKGLAGDNVEICTVVASKKGACLGIICDAKLDIFAQGLKKADNRDHRCMGQVNVS